MSGTLVSAPRFRRTGRDDPLVSSGDPRLALAGAELLALIRDWPAWTHRRVEHVTFLEEDLVRRRISVDLTVPERAPAMWHARLVPLGLLRKGRLEQFDLRREGGESLPLLSSAQNGPLSTEVLAAAAGLVVGEDGPLPEGLRASLVAIATGDGATAVEAWRELGVPGDDERDARWREVLAADGWFMELGLNLAYNFLVLAVVEAQVGERRVLKLSYVRRVGAEAPAPRVAGIYEVRSEPSATARLEITATVAVPGRARPGPLRRVTLRVVEVSSGRTVAWLATDRDGKAGAWVVPGAHRVEIIRAPASARQAGRSVEVDLAADATREVTLEFEPAGGGLPRPSVPRVVAPRALAPRRLELPVPGLRFGASAHLEIEAPDGLRVTRAELHELPGPTDQPGAGAPARDDLADEPVQRAHLYLPGTGREHSGACDVWLRPRPGTILAPAALVAGVATLLLALVTWRLDELTATVGGTGSLLLLVPGLASAYLARPREDPFTSHTLLAVRVWALVPALATLTAAAALLLARSSLEVRGVPATGAPTALARPLLSVATLAALVSFVVLVTSWRAAMWPPESRAAGRARM
jgi:hypothetical protein